MKILVIGRSGQLATELQRTGWPSGSEIIATGREQLDVTDRDAVADAVATTRPQIVINTAAYTAVDRAQSEEEQAYKLNHAAPEYLAAALARHDIPLVHLSTDYVFDGRGSRPWHEDDTPQPLSVYGQSKLAGERAVTTNLRRHVILRTSWLYAAHGQNFVRTMLRLGAERESLRIVDDQWGCPTSAADLARVIARIVDALSRGQDAFGTYHYAGAGSVTWYEFAAAIFETAGDLMKAPPRLVPITTAEFGAPAPRPAFSVLDCGKIERDFGVVPEPWRDGLKRVIAELRANAGR